MNIILWPIHTQKAKFFLEGLGLEGEFSASAGWLNSINKTLLDYQPWQLVKNLFFKDELHPHHQD
jgi:hypothetical protein